MTENQELNSPVNVLWMKYCGISDEYKMLKNRWCFLHEEYKHVIPIKKIQTDKITIFDIVDKEINNINKSFKWFNLDRKELSSPKKIDIERYRELHDRVMGLIDWVSFLKVSFFQRTVSMEIPHLSFGLPRSPERTIGNELFYLAADKCVEKYSECVQLHGWNWDGFVTFMPALQLKEIEIELSMKRIGAGIAFFRRGDIFHILMPDHQKYFIGACILFAHEIGHVPLRQYHKVSKDVPPYYLNPSDLPYSLRMELPRRFNDILRGLAPSIAQEFEYPDEECKTCNILKLGMTQIEEIFADIIAYNISGEMSIEAFIDEAFNLYHRFIFKLAEPDHKTLYIDNLESDLYQHIIRCYATLYYISVYQSKRKHLKNKIEKILENWSNRSTEILHKFSNRLTDAFPDIKERVENHNICLQCGKSVGIIIAKSLFKTGLGPKVVEECINEKMVFKLNYNEERTIINKLQEGIICQEYDPRKILYCFYKSFKKGDINNRPSYAATIQSIAFNQFKEKR